MRESVPIDLEHLGLQGAICTYLLEEPEPALVDPGPPTTLERLREGLDAHGVAISDLRHLLLTHIHLDHAGVTGHLVEENPEITVHVHEEGAPHLVDPERLVASTRRTFGDDHDRLWGEVKPVPEARIQAWGRDAPDPLKGIETIHTPGHIDSHLAYLDAYTGTLYAGDCMGIILSDEGPTHPPTPPPSLDLKAWDETLRHLEVVGAERAAVAHFGIHDRFEARRSHLREELRLLGERVRRALERGDAEEAAERYAQEVRNVQNRHLPGDRALRYFETFSAAKDWEGVVFYLTRRAEA